MSSATAVSGSSSHPSFASLRVARGLSVTDVARALVLSTAQVRALEDGDTRPFYNRYFYRQAEKKYALYLGVTLDESNPDVAPEERVPVPSNLGPPNVGALSRAGLVRLAGLSLDVATVLGLGTATWNASRPATHDTRADDSEDQLRAGQSPRVEDARSRALDTPVDLTMVDTPFQPSPEQLTCAPAKPFGSIRVKESTWLFVRYGMNRVEQRAITPEEPYVFTDRPRYLVVGSSSVELLIGGVPRDISPWKASGTLRMGASALESLPFPPRLDGCHALNLATGPK
jgi:hypothetical protein